MADDSDELVLGLLGGYVGSDLTFAANPAVAHVSGAQVGGYAGWLEGDDDPASEQVPSSIFGGLL